MDCAGVKDLPHEFIVKIEENGHTRHFRYTRFKKDDEGDVLYWEYKTSDGIVFTVFND